MFEIHKIKIACDLELPLVCDLQVLGRLQEKYDSIEIFEKKILGYDSKTKKIKEPDILAVLTGLDYMITEGIKLDKELNGNIYPIKSMSELNYRTERDYRAIANDLHNELARCFQIKN